MAIFDGYAYAYGGNENKLSSPNGGAPVKTTGDSSSTNTIDSQETIRWSSSKSVVILDPGRKIIDTPTRRPSRQY